MSNPLESSFGFGKPNTDHRKVANEPLRILFLTDLGATCRSRGDKPLASRPMRTVDVDTFDSLLGAEQPVFHAASGDIRLNELDDFHPDQLSEKLQVFQTLESLCRRLRTPSTFENAASEVRAMLQTEVAGPTDTPVAETEDDADTLSRLFGKPAAPSSSAAAPATGGGFLGDLFHKAAQAHIVADADPRADVYVTAVEAAATAHMRAILHDPAFQSLEAAWRGLNLLVSNIETDDALSLHVWNVAKSELVEAMGPADGAPDQSVLHHRIIEQREAEPFTLIVSDIVFERENDDLRLLATLGAMAGRSGALVLAGIAPEMVGAASWDALAQAPNTPLEPDATWAALRASAIGRQIVTFAPRFILRMPYGPRLDTVDTFFEFEELEQPGDVQAPVLWGASSLLGTVLIAQSFTQDGWDARLNTNQVFDDLPFVPYHEDGEKHMRPCAEVLLSDSATETVSRAGPVPVVAVHNQNAVRLSGFQSIASGSAGDRIGHFYL